MRKKMGGYSHNVEFTYSVLMFAIESPIVTWRLVA